MLGLGKIIESARTYWNGNKLIAEIEIRKEITEVSLQESLDYKFIQDVVNELVKELTPIIKDKLLESDEFAKILQEIRLEIVKKIIN